MPDTLHYSEHKPPGSAANQASLPVVLLLHGLFGNSDNLSAIRKHLQEQYRVINIDLPDHGKSPRSSHFSFEGYAQQVIMTLQQMDIKSASVIGHSLGGKVAMWIAYLNAQLVDKLIILDIAPVSYEPRHQNVISALKAVALNNIKSRKDAQQSMSQYIEDAGTQAFLLKSLYEHDEQWDWRFNLKLLDRDYATLSDWTLSDQLVYKDDVLFIKASNSDYIVADYQMAINKQFPKAKAKIVNAGHWLHAEKPQLVNRLITKHLLDE